MSESGETLDALIGSGKHGEDGWRYTVQPEWMQGRTAYGGLSAALALDAALRDHPGDAPLRTAQIGFVGPVGEQCAVTTRLLRQSRSSRFVTADLTSESGYGTHGLFSFLSRRNSDIDYQHIPPPEIADPDQLEDVPDHPMRPAFTRKFAMRPRGGAHFGADGTAEIIAWVRWNELPACNPHLALLALADALPPATIRLFPRFGPISSSTWIQHFLTDEPSTQDGWWLLVSQSGQARGGFSPQTMQIWNSERQLIATGGQGVAIYV